MVAAPPSVTDVKIVGDVVEGSIIKGVGEYFGGREGTSKFEWLRENKETRLVCSNWLLGKEIGQMFFLNLFLFSHFL